jgi:hypothetical protein
MISSEKNTNSNNLLKWLMNAALMVGLIVFSGNISEFKSYSPERVKTELKEEARLTNSKRTACFKKNQGVKLSSFPELLNGQTTNFISWLLHYENNVKIKLRINVSKIAAQNQKENFLKFYIFHNSTKSDSDSQRG